MSRGFVKEADYIEPAPDRTTPAAITASAMASLERRLATTAAPQLRAELERRIATSFVPEPLRDPCIVAFGATVRVSDETAEERTFTIVGEDDIDVAGGSIGATSPLARALLGARAGDVVTWHRPAGDRTLRVSAVSYEIPLTQ